jgi:hypothetical protein
MNYLYPTQSSFRNKNKHGALKTIAAVGVGALCLWAVYARCIKPGLLYSRAPIKAHCVQKGDKTWNYYQAENTKHNLNWSDYTSDMLRINDSDIESLKDPRKMVNIENLIAGTTIYLRDLNRDGKVGEK